MKEKKQMKRTMVSALSSLFENLSYWSPMKVEMTSSRYI